MGIARKIWQWLARSSGEKLGRVVARFVQPYEVGRPVITEGNRVLIADEGYRRSSLIHACVTEFATSLAEPPLIAERGTVRLDPTKDLLAELVENPNPETTPYQYTERIGSDLKIHGEAIVHLLRSKAGIIRELWPLRVDRVEVIPAADGKIARYDLTNGASQHPIDSLSPADVMHIKLYNPLNDYRGLSPIFVLLVEGQLDKDAILYLGEFFRNNGIPSAIITSANELLPKEREDIVQEFIEGTGQGIGGMGGTRWHRPFVMSKGATIQQWGIDPGKLDVSAVFDTAESRVCSVMGVPAILVGVGVGLKQSQAYGTAREARRGWWGETLAPFLERLNQIHTLRIAREFGAGYRLRYDVSNIQALIEAKSQPIQSSSTAFNAGIISRDEARAWCGLPPHDNGQVFRWELLAQEALMSGGNLTGVALRDAIVQGGGKLSLPTLVGHAA